MARKNKNQSVILELSSPLPDSFDNKDIRELMSDAGIIPYFGYNDTASHTVLYHFADLYQWSNTNRACINAIRDYAFQGKLRLIKSSVGGFDLGTDTVYASEAEVRAFIDALTNLGISATEITELTKQLYINLAVFGNYYLRVEITSLAGVRKVRLECIPAQNAAYQLEKDAAGNLVDLPERHIVVSESFDKQYLSKYPAKAYHIFPTWTEIDRNTITTVFHIKNQTDKSPYYGRPDSIDTYQWKFIEYYTADKTATISRQDFVSLYMLFSEAPVMDTDATDEDFETWTNALRNLTTMSNSGKAKTLANLQYPHGTKEPNLAKLDIQRDTAWFEAVLAKAASKIIQSHGWFAELLGEKMVSNGVGKDSALLTVYTVADSAKISPLQDFFSSEWSKVFAAIDEKIGTNLAEFQIEFPQNIKKLAEKIKAVQTVQTIQSNGNTTN